MASSNSANKCLADVSDFPMKYPPMSKTATAIILVNMIVNLGLDFFLTCVDALAPLEAGGLLSLSSEWASKSGAAFSPDDSLADGTSLLKTVYSESRPASSLSA